MTASFRFRYRFECTLSDHTVSRRCIVEQIVLSAASSQVRRCGTFKSPAGLPQSVVSSGKVISLTQSSTPRWWRSPTDLETHCS